MEGIDKMAQVMLRNVFREEFHDCQMQEDWTRMESQLAAQQMEKSDLQMELTNVYMALEDAGLRQ